MWSIVARKAETNFRVLTGTSWAWVLVGGLGLLGFARFGRPCEYDELTTANPGFAAAVTATLVAGALALVTEDSGIVIPSLIMIYSGTGLAWLMLVRLTTTTDHGESS